MIPDFLEVVDGQPQHQTVSQQYAQQQQQQRPNDFDFDHGDEVRQHPANPPIEDFMPGHRTGCAT